jgi:hypothetical protein
MNKTILYKYKNPSAYLLFTGLSITLSLTACNAYQNTNSSNSLQKESTITAASQTQEDIQANYITSNSATVTWLLNKTSSVVIQWGETGEYEFTTQANGESAAQQSVNLSGLKPDTTYHFRLVIKDESGAVETSKDMTFKTLERLYSRLLEVSDIGILKVAGTSATISWATDAPATGQIEYGLSDLYGSLTGIDNNFAFDHSIELKQLKPNATYHYRVHSLDQSGNEGVSTDQEFKTTGSPDSTAPTISNINITNVTHDSATVNWVTGELAIGEVAYDIVKSYANVTPIEKRMSYNHTVILNKLQNGLVYHLVVKSQDSSGNISTSPDMTFITEKAAAIIGTSTSYHHTQCKCR